MKKRTLNLICATLLTLGCAQTTTPGPWNAYTSATSPKTRLIIGMLSLMMAGGFFVAGVQYTEKTRRVEPTLSPEETKKHQNKKDLQALGLSAFLTGAYIFCITSIHSAVTINEA